MLVGWVLDYEGDKMMLSTEKGNALIKLIILRNLRGEYVAHRDEYLYRFNFALPSSIPKNVRAEVEEIDGVYYSHDARKSVESMLMYQPFKGEFELLSQRYMMPERYFELIKDGKPINVYSYFVDFKGAEVIEEKTHMLNGRPHIKEYVLRGDEGKRWKVILRRYGNRPAWRGMRWQEQQVQGVAADELYYAAGVYLKSKEVFKEALINAGKKRVRSKFTAYMFRYIKSNPVIDDYFNGFIVDYKTDRELLLREFVELTDAKRVAEHIREVGEHIESGSLEDTKKQLLKLDTKSLLSPHKEGKDKAKENRRGVEIE